MDGYQTAFELCDRCEENPNSLELHEAMLAAVDDVDDAEGTMLVISKRLLGRGQPHEIRLLIGCRLLDVACYADALSWLDGEDPKLQLARGHALVLLGRRDDARVLLEDLERQDADLGDIHDGMTMKSLRRALDRA